MPGDYDSHYAVLAAVVAKVCGSVIEFGAGEGSTPMLHYMCKGIKAPLLTLESDPVWLERFVAYASPTHHLKHVLDWRQWAVDQFNMGGMWGVAFVDCAPGDMRSYLIGWLQRRARYIVVHDTETDYATGANYKYEPVFARFKHRQDFRRWRPYTTVLSDEAPFDIDECDRIWVPNEAQREYFKKMGITG